MLVPWQLEALPYSSQWFAVQRVIVVGRQQIGLAGSYLTATLTEVPEL